jgi:hypothetical protein
VRAHTVKCTAVKTLLPPNLVKSGIFQTLALSALFITGLVLGALPWNSIQLPFHNPYEMVEVATRLEQNPMNQAIRFAVYVLTPSLLLALLLLRLRPKAQPTHPASIAPRWVSRWSMGFLLGFPLWSLAAYFSRPLGPRYFDLLHHGEQMTPAWNVLFKGGFWTTTYFLHGVFFDVLIALSGWKFWGVRSFGAYELTDALLWALVPAALCFFLFALGRVATSDRLGRSVLTQVALAVFLLAGIHFHYSPHRYIPVYLGFGCFLLATTGGKSLLYFMAGFFQAVCLTYSIDMGVYYSVALTGLCALLAVTDHKRFRSQRVLFWTLAGVLAGGCIFLAVFGWDEAQAFVRTTLSQLRHKDLLDWIMLRSPLEKGGGYSRTNMSVIALVLFATTWELFGSRPWREKFLPLFFAGASLLFFRSALGRADVGHIQYASSFAYLALGYWVWRRYGDAFSRRARWFLPLLWLLNSALIVRAMGWVDPAAGFTFGTRARAYVQMPDADFLMGREEGVAKLKEIFFPEPCLFSLTLDAGMGYLLKKTTCNRFFIPWFASARPLREELLSSLIAKEPRVILVESPNNSQDVDGISNRERFADLYHYVDSHYLPVEKVQGWGIRRLRP